MEYKIYYHFYCCSMMVTYGEQSLSLYVVNAVCVYIANEERTIICRSIDLSEQSYD